MTTLYFDNYREANRVFRETVQAIGDNPMVDKVRYARGGEGIYFRDGSQLIFRVTRYPVIETALSARVAEVQRAQRAGGKVRRSGDGDELP